MKQAIRNLWRRPRVRFVARTLGVAVATAAAKSYLDGANIEAVYAAALTAGGTALLGLLTPLEPFVGAWKPQVEVPAAQATLVDAHGTALSAARPAAIAGPREPGPGSP